MSGSRYLGSGGRPPRPFEKSVSADSKLGAPVKTRKAEWEAKVRASFVANVVRGPSKLEDESAVVSGSNEVDLSASKARVQGTAALPRSRAMNHSGQTPTFEEIKPGSAGNRRRALSTTHCTSRANWEAQVRASFVTEVVRGPLDANCGRTTYDGAELAACAEEETDDLGFLARRQEIARKVQDTESEITSVLEKLRSDLKEMQEEDVAISMRLDSLQQQVKDVDRQLELHFCGYTFEYPTHMESSSSSSMSLMSSESQSAEQPAAESLHGHDGFVHNEERYPSKAEVATAVNWSTHSGDSGLSVGGSHETSESDSDEQMGAEDVFENQLSDSEPDGYHLRKVELKRGNSIASGIHGNELIDLYLRKEHSVRQDLGLNTSNGGNSASFIRSNRRKRDSGFVEDCTAAGDCEYSSSDMPRRAGSPKPGQLTRGRSVPTIRSAAVMRQGGAVHNRSFQLAKVSHKQAGTTVSGVPHQGRALPVHASTTRPVEISC